MVNFQDSFEDALRMGLARGVQMSGAGKLDCGTVSDVCPLNSESTLNVAC